MEDAFRLLLLLSISLLLLLSSPVAPSTSGAAYSDLFESWIERHGKRYASEEAKLAGFRAFRDNLAFIDEHNSRSGGSSYQLGLNAFADLSHREFKAARLGLGGAALALPRRANRTAFAGSDDGTVPESVDWRERGAVTGVKDQGNCGACWTFSTTGAIEGINKIVTGSLLSLSEQELCDCDFYDSCCEGGLMDNAFKWVVQNHGINTEDDYPYQAAQETCLEQKVTRRVVTIDGYTDVLPYNEKALLQAVATQPVSVGISGSERAFQLYSKGIFTGPCTSSLDHAVLIVGYGSENGKDYWIVKNSWGKRWGMDGYVFMLRNSGNPEGVCGINMLASFPTKMNPNPPPPPPPGPVKCNALFYCAEGNTCCCTWHALGVCLSWSCCDLDNAVCCDDSMYCCPHDYPICDSSKRECFKEPGNSSSIKAVAKKKSLKNLWPWNDMFKAWHQ